jgi:flagellar biogenesis protein FliO
MGTTHRIVSPVFPRPIAGPFVLLQKLVSFILSRCTKANDTGERLLTLEGRLAIGPKETLTLVQCAGRRYLVAAGGGSIVSLTEVSSPSGRRQRVRKEEQ